VEDGWEGYRNGVSVNVDYRSTTSLTVIESCSDVHCIPVLVVTIIRWRTGPVPDSSADS